MRAPIRLRALLCATMLLSATASAMDEHSLGAVRDALRSPIPESAIAQARQLDDQMLRTGTAMGTKVYLVTDDRQQHVQAVVSRVLTAIGESPHGWVVRLWDTSPKVVNAFVNGGKYIYVFTGLLEQAKSDDELAVVVGHEMGHSMLKHNIRRGQDLSTTLANLAEIYGSLKGGTSGATAMAMGKALHNGYSRDDEREADAFGVLAAWRAKFDPLAGAGFFTRMEQADDRASAAQSKELEGDRAQLLAVKAQCENWRAQWNSGQAAHTQQNANTINQRCAQYEQARLAYNAAVAQQAAAELQTETGDHPENQERVASIAAITDWLRGARTLKSLEGYPRAYCVIAALVQVQSPIIMDGDHQSAIASASGGSSASGSAADDFNAISINSLDELRTYYLRFLNHGNDSDVIRHGMEELSRLRPQFKGAPTCMLQGGSPVELGDYTIRGEFNIVERCRTSTGRVSWWYEDKSTTFRSVSLHGTDIVATRSDGTTIVLDGTSGHVLRTSLDSRSEVTSERSSNSSASGHASDALAGAERVANSPFINQLNALDDAFQNGVITKGEYDRKMAALMAKHRAERASGE